MTRIVFDGVDAKAVYAQGSESLLRALGGKVRRASHVYVIEEGPEEGLYFADLSALGEDHQVCLWPPKVAYKEVIAAELAYLDRWLVRAA